MSRFTGGFGCLKDMIQVANKAYEKRVALCLECFAFSTKLIAPYKNGDTEACAHLGVRRI